MMFFDAFSFAFPAALQRIPYSLFVSLIWTVVTYFPVGLSAEPSRCALVLCYATLCCAVLCVLCCAVLCCAMLSCACCAALCCALLSCACCCAVLPFACCAALRCVALQCAMLLKVKLHQTWHPQHANRNIPRPFCLLSNVTSSEKSILHGIWETLKIMRCNAGVPCYATSCCATLCYAVTDVW